MARKEGIIKNPEQELFVNEKTHTPFIYQINAEPFLKDIIEEYDLSQNTRLTEIPLDVWRRVKQDTQADHIYFLGMYPESKIAHDLAVYYAKEHLSEMEGLTLENIRGSIFAVPTEEEFHPFVASSNADYLEFKKRLAKIGLKISLDEIPNHTSIDTFDKDMLMTLTKQEYDSIPQGAKHNFLFLADENIAIGFGKEFSEQEWIDTAQRPIYKKQTLEKLLTGMVRRMEKADGFRVDMAHLITLEAFKRAWGWTGIQVEDEASLQNFWRKTSVYLHSLRPDFLLFAEAYGKEYVDQLFTAFDGVYDKEYYDFLVEVSRGNRPVWEVTNRLLAREQDPNRHQRVRFMQNHDEQPARRVFGERASLAFGALQIFEPSGILLFQDAQMFGFKHKMPVQVNHYPREQREDYVYHALSQMLRLRKTNAALISGEGRILQAYNSEFAGYIDNSEMVGFIYHHENQGVAVCINLQNKNLDSRLLLPKGASATAIESPIDGYFQKISGENSREILVSLVPHEVQLISYKIE